MHSAGTAVAALMCARLGAARVCAQEVDERRASLAQCGAQLNGVSSIVVTAAGRWGDADLLQLLLSGADGDVRARPFDLVVAADVLYGDEREWQELLCTALGALRVGGSLVLCVEQRRHDFTSFFAQCATHFEHARLVHYNVAGDVVGNGVNTGGDGDGDGGTGAELWLLECTAYRGGVV